MPQLLYPLPERPQFAMSTKLTLAEQDLAAREKAISDADAIAYDVCNIIGLGTGVLVTGLFGLLAMVLAYHPNDYLQMAAWPGSTGKSGSGAVGYFLSSCIVSPALGVGAGMLAWAIATLCIRRPAFLRRGSYHPCYTTATITLLALTFFPLETPGSPTQLSAAERTYTIPTTIHDVVTKLRRKLNTPETDSTTGLEKEPLVPAILTAADYRASGHAYPHRRFYSGSVDLLTPYYFGNRFGPIGIQHLHKSLSCHERLADQTGTHALHFTAVCDLHLQWRELLRNARHPKLTFLGRAIAYPVVERVHVVVDHIGERVILDGEELFIRIYLQKLEDQK